MGLTNPSQDSKINVNSIAPECQLTWRNIPKVLGLNESIWCISHAPDYNFVMGKKGIRPQRGQPETDWGEPKTAKLNVGLTPTGKRLVKERANQLGISVSEVLERWARGIDVDIDNPPVIETFTPPPTVEGILASLSRYSRQQIGRIVRAGLDLLIGAPTNEDQK